MAENAARSGFEDTSSRLHKIVRIIFFISMFSWSLTNVQDYASSGTPFEKVVMRIIPLMITAAYIICSNYRKNIKQLLRPFFWPIWIYIFFGVLCGAWGGQPFLSAWKGVELTILLLWCCATCYDTEHLKIECTAILKYVEILTYITLALAIIRPSLGFMNSPTGIPWLRGYAPMLNPNTVGFLAAVSFTSVLFQPGKWKPMRLGIITLILLFAQSRTQYATCAVILVLYVIDGLRTRQLSRVLIASLGGVFAAFLAFGMFDRVVNMIKRGQDIEEIGSLSGRTEYWAVAWSYAGMLGKGFATGSRNLIYVTDGVFAQNAVNLHSTYLEAILGAGYIGSALYLFSIVTNFVRQSARFLLRTRIDDALFAALMVIIFARSVVSISVALYTVDFCLFVFICIYVSFTSKEVRIAPEPPKPRVRLQIPAA